MTTVHLVLQGLYSDRCVVHIASTAQLAKQYVDTHGGEAVDVESWTLDDPESYFEELTYLHIAMELVSGQHRFYDCKHTEKHVHYKWTVVDKVLHMVLWARTKQHAIKIANEKRASILDSMITTGQVVKDEHHSEDLTG